MAQTAYTATVAPPASENFPRLETTLDIHDAQGGFVHGLQAEDVRVIENGQAITPLELKELRPGVQIAMAINPGMSFAVRNSQGISRYDLLQAALLDWAQRRKGSNLDDLSLLAAAGSERTHISSLDDFAQDLAAYQPDARAMLPRLDLLQRAVQVAADNPPRQGMERVVLFITAPLEGDFSLGIEELISFANQRNVHIFVWLAASPQVLESAATRQLENMALRTGGQFIAYTGEEALPDPEGYFQPLRDIYFLAYESAISQGGQQQIAVEVQIGDQRVLSAPLTFPFNLQPPDPAFVSPVAEIVRAIPAEMRPSPWEAARADDLFPQEQSIQVMVLFPDGRDRPLQRTALYVDGVLADENTSPPFDRFTWNLDAYSETMQHVLQVEALDSLGLRGASILTPVQMQVDLPQPSPWAGLARHWPAVAALTGALALALAALALVLSGRLQPRLIGAARRTPRARPAQTKPERPRGGETARAGDWVNRLHWPQRRLNPKAHAYLTRLNEGGEPRSTPPISISADEVTIGSDPDQATLLLNDPSVSALHARLVRAEDNSFRLFDQDSIAGAWINYLPVSPQGSELIHGDLLHIGRVAFRFNQNQPIRQRHVVVAAVQEPPA